MQQFPFIAEIFVLGGIASAAVIAVDLRSCRQTMRIMNSVWVLTGLWASFFGLWAYFAFGRTRSCLVHERSSVPETEKERCKQVCRNRRKRERGMASTPDRKKDAAASDLRTEHPMRMRDTRADGKPGAGTKKTHAHVLETTEKEGTHRMRMRDMRADGKPGAEMKGVHAIDMPRKDGMRMKGAHAENMPGMGTNATMRPRWQSVVLSTLHCGAGCTLADLVGEWFVYFVPVAIGGSLIAGSWVLDYVLALLFGIGFQYAAIRGMERTLPRRVAVRRAAKADFWSLTAWQAGMYGWMAVVIFALNDGYALPRDTFSFWFMMQIAMACGFLLALPVNVRLIRRGVKHAM